MKITIIKFGAEWCSPCRAIKPILQKLSLKYPEVELIECDVESDNDMAEKYKIMSLPTIVSIHNDVETNRLIGLINENDIEKMFLDLINYDKE